MDFKIIIDDDGSYEAFHGDATYRFNDAGLLQVVTDEGLRRVYSPTGWRYVEESQPRPTLGIL